MLRNILLDMEKTTVLQRRQRTDWKESVWM